MLINVSVTHVRLFVHAVIKLQGTSASLGTSLCTDTPLNCLHVLLDNSKECPWGATRDVTVSLLLHVLDTMKIV
jgi:hypothetical protein